LRTTVEIDDELMEQALRVSPLRTKREVFEEALRLLVQRDAQRRLKDFRGSDPGAEVAPRRRARP
jgi:Arc/MetJ family transcription regulator